MKNLLKTLCCCTIFIWFVSCSNEQEGESLKSDLTRSHIPSFYEIIPDSATFVSYRNCENPFTSIGDLHNVLMDSIRINQINQINLKNYVYGKILERSVLTSSSNDSLFFDTQYVCRQYDIQRLMNGVNVLDSLIANMPISWKRHISDIDDILISEEMNVDVVNAQFENIFYDINTDPDLNNTGRVFLLAASAIAQATYTANQIEGKVAPNRAQKVMKADFLGGIGGFIVGGISGHYHGATLLFGPEGLVVAVTRDVFLGATVSSGLSLVWS